MISLTLNQCEIKKFRQDYILQIMTKIWNGRKNYFQKNIRYCMKIYWCVNWLDTNPRLPKFEFQFGNFQKYYKYQHGQNQPQKLPQFIFITWTISQIIQCIRQISHNAPLCNRNVHKCAHFCYNVVPCGIWDWCIMAFVRWIYQKARNFSSIKCSFIYDLFCSKVHVNFEEEQVHQ